VLDKPNLQFDDERVEQAKRNQGPLDDGTSEVLTRVYVARRLNYQLEYYQSKMAQYQNHEDNAFRLNAIIMTLTSLFAALGTQPTSPQVLRLLTAVLPAFAALVAGFRQLYQWDRQSQLFKDSVLGLQRASLVLPDPDQVDKQTAARVYPTLVETTEKVFEDEVSQWGQIALGDQKKESEQADILAKFAEELGIDIYDAQGNIDPSKLGAVSEILKVSRSSGELSSLNLSVDYPAVGAGETNIRQTATRPVADDEIEAEEHIDDEEPDITGNTDADNLNDNDDQLPVQRLSDSEGPSVPSETLDDEQTNTENDKPESSA